MHRKRCTILYRNLSNGNYEPPNETNSEEMLFHEGSWMMNDQGRAVGVVENENGRVYTHELLHIYFKSKKELIDDNK